MPRMVWSKKFLTLSSCIMLPLNAVWIGHSVAFSSTRTVGRVCTRGVSLRRLATEYTIDEVGVDQEVLEKTIKKHWENLPRFLESKPVAAHTKEAFAVLSEQLGDCQLPMILDSGCGTGRSTETLARMYPDHIVIGIDRSIARLSKNSIYTQQSSNGSGNMLLVRAELADFWRLWLQDPLGNVEKHFLLYPNPYPKKRRFQNRWYAHPAFPLLLQLGGEEIVVRSNWKAFLEDFEQATLLAAGLGGEDASNAYYSATSIERLDPTKEAWTNFEAKYFNVGEIAYELRLRATSS